MNDSLFSELLLSCQELKVFLGHGVTASTSGSNPLSLCSNQSAPAITLQEYIETILVPIYRQMEAEPVYIDDATGQQVSEDWWPGDSHEAD